MTNLPKKFLGLSDAALVAAKHIFSLAGDMFTLEMGNKENQLPRNTAEALKELVDKGLLNHVYHGPDRLAEIYSMKDPAAFDELRRTNVKVPKGLDLRIAQPIDPSKPLDLVVPSWAYAIVGNYRRASDVSNKVTDGMIFVVVQKYATFDEDVIIDEVRRVEERVS